MPKVKVNTQLRQFLQSVGEWEQFKYEIKQFYLTNTKRIPPETQVNRLASAFEWVRTKDGMQHWSTLDDEYEKYKIECQKSK